MAKSTTPRLKKDGTPYAPKGAELRWSPERDLALVQTIANYQGDITPADLADKLTSHTAFAEVEDGAISAAKVRLRVINLRESGVAIPALKRSPGGGGFGERTKYVPDADALNAVLNAVLNAA